jgi:hypothetical protein
MQLKIKNQHKLKDLKAILAQLDLDASYETACVLAALGDKDKAFHFLNKSYENHHPYIYAEP